MTGRLDVVLHVGMGKTGTTSVQSFLRDNREGLAAAGLLYPQTPGRARHLRLSTSVRSPEELALSPEWQREPLTDIREFRRRFRRRLSREIERSGLTRVLFSDEVLFGSSYPTVRRLGEWAWRLARSVRVVVYLRRQDDHLVSRYQQEVKVGCIQRLEDWARQDFSSLYDYRARLRAHEELLSPTALVVRPYDRSSFVDGSLHQDFLDAVGLELRADEMVQVEDRNPSLDMEAIEFLRLLNLCRVESGSGTPGLIDNRDLVRRLEPASSGPVPTLPAKTLDRFMAQWKRSNKQVARELLGRRNGRLFTTPRKSGNTTTEQRLDPARLDHLLAVSQAAEDLHDPLRALAERETSTRRPVT